MSSHAPLHAWIIYAHAELDNVSDSQRGPPRWKEKRGIGTHNLRRSSREACVIFFAKCILTGADGSVFRSVHSSNTALCFV